MSDTPRTDALAKINMFNMGDCFLAVEIVYAEDMRKLEL